jgi:hypothetical protein
MIGSGRRSRKPLKSIGIHDDDTKGWKKHLQDGNSSSSRSKSMLLAYVGW